jgi:hypothetical protein
MMNWSKWIGLPHEVGADPDDGVGIDCLMMAYKLRTAAGLYMPSLDATWFEMVDAGQWQELRAEWDRLMCPCDAEPYALLLHHQPGRLGVSIAIDGGILLVHHRRGAQWVPVDVAGGLMELAYWRPRDAAI